MCIVRLRLEIKSFHVLRRYKNQLTQRRHVKEYQRLIGKTSKFNSFIRVNGKATVRRLSWLSRWLIHKSIWKRRLKKKTWFSVPFVTANHKCNTKWPLEFWCMCANLLDGVRMSKHFPNKNVLGNINTNRLLSKSFWKKCMLILVCVKTTTKHNNLPTS